jgi:D-methionine transport system permease protein
MNNGLVNIIFEALLDTMYMVFVSTIISIILGFAIAILLILTNDDGFNPNKILYNTLDFIINIIRSYPFIILIIVLLPVTRFITGSTIEVNAAIVPLTIGATPFVARIIENALKEVDRGVIEAAKSFGATPMQIIFKVMIIEALPALISGLTLTIITIVGYSAMAGAVGAGGLGAVAIMYGYNMFNEKVLAITVVILIILVQAIQGLGNLVYSKIK